MADEKYIKCEDAIKGLHRTYEYEFPTASGAFDEFATRIVPNVLRNLPAADVQSVVRGQWIKINGLIACSVCKNHPPRTYHNFCPDCGADMRVINND